MKSDTGFTRNTQYASQGWEIDRERREDSDFRLIRKARRYDIPIPSKQEKEGLWEEFEQGFWLLTDQGVHHLLKEIRAEQKERLALWKAWFDLILGWVPAIIGLIGTLIGLVSVLRK